MTKKKTSKRQKQKLTVSTRQPAFAASSHKYFDFLVHDHNCTIEEELYGYTAFVRYSNASVRLTVDCEMQSLPDVTLVRILESGEPDIYAKPWDVSELADEELKSWLAERAFKYEGEAAEYEKDIDETLRQLAEVVKRNRQIMDGDMSVFDKHDDD